MNMLIKIGKVLLVCTIILGIHLTAAGQAKAADFLDLEIDGGVSVPWDIDNVVPGDSGVIDVSIRNSGNIHGYIAVWISGIVDTEGANPESETGNKDEPGELSQYLTLGISGDDISPYTSSSSFEAPVTLNSFPGSSLAPLQLSDQPLSPGETIQVQWEWAVPPPTTNIIQGDQVSFNINYVLTQYLIVTKNYFGGNAGGNSPGVYSGDSDTLDDEADKSAEDIAPPDAAEEEESAKGADIPDENKITRIFSSPDDQLFIKVPQETRVISPQNEELSYIIIGLSSDTLFTSQDSLFLSAIYDLTTFTQEGQYKYPDLNKQVTIIIFFDKNRLPEQFASIYVAQYTDDSGWVRLTGVQEIDYETGTITVKTTRLSTIAVFVTAGAFEDITPPVKGDDLKPVLPASEDSPLKTGTGDGFLLFDSPAREILRQISLIVAISGALSMTALAYIERRRRENRHA